MQNSRIGFAGMVVVAMVVGAVGSARAGMESPAGSFLDGTVEVAERTTPGEGLELVVLRSVAREGDDILEARFLRVDPKRYRLRSALALNQTVGRETTSSIARRHGAVAAVNGGFFGGACPYTGDPALVYAADGRVLSEPGRERSAFAIFDGPDGQRGRIGYPALDASVTWASATTKALPVSGVNRSRGDEEVIWYTPECHRTTLTYPGGTEVVIEGDRIRRVIEGGGDTPIPAAGGVLSFGPEAWDKVPADGKPVAGDRVRLRIQLVDDGGESWTEAAAVMNGFGLLVRGGEAQDAEDFQAREISESFAMNKHPRTVVGWDADGTWILGVIDGRQEEISLGINLETLARLMVELGAIEALNLDGGGSSAIYVDGEVRNHPSDGNERMVSDAVMVLPIEP